jgi:hypothetical protein
LREKGFDPTTFNVGNLPITLMHKRALVAAKNNVLNKLVATLYPGLTKNNLNFDFIKKNLLKNLLTRQGANKLKHAAWRVGLEGQRKKARANFNKFTRGNRTPPASPRRKTPSPPRARTPRRSPVRAPNPNTAFERWHRLAPATNDPVTWSRNQNGKVTRRKTLTEVARSITPIQRLALAAMKQNEKQKFLKFLAGV